MFEDRAKAYKRGLIDQARPHLEPGEEVRVLALAQARVGPFIQAAPMGLGVSLVLGSFVGDTYLPASVGVAGALIVFASIALAWRVPRLLLLRTDDRLYEFKLPGSPKAKVEEPLAVHQVAELPAPTAGKGRSELGGKRLWANYGAPGERAALARALDPADPRAAEGVTA